MATVLMGFAEAVPAPEALFSLQAAGHEVRLFSRKGPVPITQRRLAPEKAVTITAPETDAAAARADLLAALAADPPDMLYAIDDPSLWLVASLDGELPPGIRVVNAMGEPARIALDKRAQVAAARAAGLAVPETLEAGSAADIRDFQHFPCIAKPALAADASPGRLAKGGASYFLDAAALAVLPDAGHGIGLPALVQPLIRGTGVGVFGFATEAGVVNWSGHERVRMVDPHGSGSSACKSRMPTAETRSKVAAMMAAIGWRGPFMVEFLEDASGTLWFMELNGRLWGSLALARRQGFEYPAWAVAPETMAAVTPGPDGRVVRHLGRDILHVLHVLRGPKSDFHKAGWPGVLPALAAVLRPHGGAGFYNYDPAHRGFFLREAAAVVAGKLRR